MIVLAVLAGGMIGAPVRYLVDRAVQARHDSVFPWGTLAVNLAGSAVLGFLLAFINRLNGSNVEPLLSLYGIGMLVVGAVSGAILYVLIYRFWPRGR